MEKRDEARDADDIDGRAHLVVVVRHRGQRHVTAVASAVDADAIAVEHRIALDPVDDGADVLDRVLAFVAIVHREKCLSVAGRATHVREDERDAELIDPVVAAPKKSWAALPLRTTVNDHECRTLPGKSRRIGTIDKCRDHRAVEALHRGKLRIHIA